MTEDATACVRRKALDFPREFPEIRRATRIDSGAPPLHRPPTVMAENPSRRPDSHPLPVFPIACWALGLMAFSQLLIAGMALAERFEHSRVVKIVEKEVPKLITVRIPAAPVETVDPAYVAARSLFDETPPEPSPVITPEVADPRSGRLLDEARRARIAGDMGLALVKLGEAKTRSPEDPNVYYELGLVHEMMGVWDTAIDSYQHIVFGIGATKAGSLYKLAVTKLRDGFKRPDESLGKLALGRVVPFADPKNEDGERVVLTIPVQRAPGAEIDFDRIFFEISFFNRSERGDIIKNNEVSWVGEQKWVTLPIDWKGNEEVARVTYVIPRQDVQTEHLFGKISYYGYVVILKYGAEGEEGEILDVQAWPPNLAGRLAQQPRNGQQLPDIFDPEFALPPNFDPDGLGVLPPRPGDDLPPPPDGF